MLAIVDREIRETELNASQLQAQIAQIESSCTIPREITADDVRELLGQLREVLEQEVSVAAPILERVTGKIYASMVERPDKQPLWTANFSVNFVEVMLELSRHKKSPTIKAWEYLNTCGWTFPISSLLVLELEPTYVRWAPIFQQMSENGASINAIARVHGKTWDYVKNVLQFAQTGQAPKYLLPRSKRKRNRKRKADHSSPRATPKYIEFAPLVMRLHDQEKMAFNAIPDRIMGELGIRMSVDTIVRAYDYARPELVNEAAQKGIRPNRGRASRLGERKYQQIRDLVRTSPELTNQQVADEVGCGSSTVHRERQKISRENEGANTLCH